MKYRKKPIVVEAFRMTPSSCKNNNTWPEWLHVAWYHAPRAGSVYPHFPDSGGGVWTVRTLEGDMRADWGDYIIRGVQGELYPCKPDIFEATYEPA